MTSNNTFASSSQPALVSRVLASVLLVLVAYGAVAGTVHTHGNIPSRLAADSTTTSIRDTGDSDSSSKKLPTRGECLVCQLQQHLSSGLQSPSIHIAEPDTHFAVASRFQLRFITQTIAARRGRAPPVISLT